MIPADAIACFKATQEIFVAITGEPSDEDILHIREVFAPILLSIPYNEVDDDTNLWGLIASPINYKARYSDTVFTDPMWPPIYPVVPPNATDPVRAKVEFKNTAKLADFYLHAAATRGCNHFVRAIIDDTWIYKIKHAAMCYVGVTVSDLLDPLQLHCGGLHILDVVDL